jgi:hypothetical protein
MDRMKGQCWISPMLNRFNLPQLLPVVVSENHKHWRGYGKKLCYPSGHDGTSLPNSELYTS